MWSLGGVLGAFFQGVLFETVGTVWFKDTIFEFLSAEGEMNSFFVHTVDS